MVNNQNVSVLKAFATVSIAKQMMKKNVSLFSWIENLWVNSVQNKKLRH